MPWAWYVRMMMLDMDREGGDNMDPKQPDAEKFEDVRPDDQRGLAEAEGDRPELEPPDELNPHGYNEVGDY